MSSATHSLPGDYDDDGDAEGDGREGLVLRRVDREGDEEAGEEEGDGEEGVVHQEREGERPGAGGGRIHCNFGNSTFHISNERCWRTSFYSRIEMAWYMYRDAIIPAQSSNQELDFQRSAPPLGGIGNILANI